METIYVKKILTHQMPDLDAMLSVLLLKRFGETKFPGSKEAPVIFCAAGGLPKGKSAEQLESEGILAVDVGGGRLDTHPVDNIQSEGDRDLCAANKVAEAVGVQDHLCWQSLIEYVRQQDVLAKNVQSKDYIHHFLSLPDIIRDIAIANQGQSEKIMEEGITLLEALPIYLERKLNNIDDLDVLDLMKKMITRYLEEKKISLEDKSPQFTSILEWRKRLFNRPGEAFSKNEVDDIISFPALVKGLWYKTEGDKESVWERIKVIFDVVLTRARLWQEALNELEHKAIHKKIKRVNVVSVASKYGMVMKAARFRYKADLIIYRHPETNATTIMVKRQGVLRKFSMINLAAKVRIAECIERGERVLYRDIWKIGDVHNWFLHQSKNLLICGSNKATQFEPSKISLDNLMGLAISEIDWNQRIPEAYCPQNSCKGRKCLFQRLNLKVCKMEQNKSREKKTYFGETLEKALQNQKG